MSQIRASINFSQRKKQVSTYNTLFNRSSAPPVNEVADESTEEPADEPDEQDELQDIEPSCVTTSDDWEIQLHDWEQMLIDEEIARSEDEEAERNNNNNMEGDLLSNYRHPAVDNRAKWELSSIFGLLFRTPNYMNDNNN